MQVNTRGGFGGKAVEYRGLAEIQQDFSKNGLSA
jgi:hypothetical protein